MAYDDYQSWYLNSVNRGKVISEHIEEDMRVFSDLRSKEYVDYHTFQFHNRWLLADNWSNIDWLRNQFDFEED
jgi:hypothetical protein